MSLTQCASCGHQISAKAVACPSCGEPRALSFDAEQAYFLQRTQVVSELQAELISWLKSRVWIGTLIGVFVGVFGLNAIVTVTIYNFLRDDLKEATRATALAEDSAKEAKSATESASGFVKELEKTAATVNQNFDRLKQRLDAESSHSRAVREQEVASVQSRISQLEGLVEEISATSDANRAALAEYNRNARQATIQAQTKAAQIEANAEFIVLVSAVGASPETVEEVRKMLVLNGFKVAYNPSPERPDRTTIVWGGERTREKSAEIRQLISSAAGVGTVQIIESPLGIESFTENYVGVFLAGS